MKYLLLPMAVLVLAGCVTTEREAYPHLDKVDVEPLPVDYSARSSESVDATTDAKADHDEGKSITAWLISFNSPELELLVITALNQNYDLKQQGL